MISRAFHAVVLTLFLAAATMLLALSAHGSTAKGVRHPPLISYDFGRKTYHVRPSECWTLSQMTGSFAVRGGDKFVRGVTGPVKVARVRGGASDTNSLWLVVRLTARGDVVPPLAKHLRAAAAPLPPKAMSVAKAAPTPKALPKSMRLVWEDFVHYRWTVESTTDLVTWTPEATVTDREFQFYTSEAKKFFRVKEAFPP